MAKLFMLCAAAVFLAAGCSSQPASMSANERKADAYLQQGVDALRRKAFSEALRSLTEASKNDPKSPAIWTDLGIAYAGKNELAKSEECWRKALALDSSHNDARLNLGVLYLNSKHYPESERLLKEAEKDISYQKADQVAFQLARLYFAQNKPLLAEQHLKIAVQNNTNHCAAWMELGNLQKARGDYVEAAKSMKGATMGFCYKNPQAHYELATLLLKTRDVPQAKAKLLEIIQLFPTSEWAEKSEATLNMIR